MSDRRGRPEIYHDILSAIKEDSQNNEKISPTRVQFKSNLSYNKLKEFVSDMTKKKLLSDETTMTITDSGTKFYNEYTEIRDMIKKLCNEVFTEDIESIFVQSMKEYKGVFFREHKRPFLKDSDELNLSGLDTKNISDSCRTAAKRLENLLKQEGRCNNDLLCMRCHPDLQDIKL